MGRTRSLAKKVSWSEPQTQSQSQPTPDKPVTSTTVVGHLANGVLSTSSIICGNQKKSLRIMMMSNRQKISKGHTKNKVNYVWPRTVESAQDPYEDDSGKNKMFYLIAINLFPESKILVPSDSEEDEEEENISPVKTKHHRHGKASKLTANSFGSDGSEYSPSPQVKHVRRGKRPYVQKRQNKSKEDEDADVSWRTAYNNRKMQIHSQPPQRRVVRPRAPPPPPVPITPSPISASCFKGLRGSRIESEDAVLDVIRAVVKAFAKKYKVKTRDPVRAMRAKSTTPASSGKSKKDSQNTSGFGDCDDSSGEEEASQPFQVRVVVDDEEN